MRTYDIAESDCSERLIDLVEEGIAMGFAPVGGVFVVDIVVGNNEYVRFYQAMARLPKSE